MTTNRSSGIKILLRCLCCLSALSLAALAQQRDSAALAILTQATTALGGKSILAQFTSAESTGSIQAVAGSTAASGTFVWKHQFSASGYQFRSQFTSNGQTSILVSGTAGGASSTNGTVRTLPAQITLALYPVHLPAVVLSVFLANPNYTITLGSPVQVDGVNANHITVSINTDPVSQAQTPEDWYFDPSSGLPLRVEFRLADAMDALQYTTGAADLANYQSVGGVLTPLLITNTENSVIVSTATITPVQWNYPVSASDFTLP